MMEIDDYDFSSFAGKRIIGSDTEIKEAKDKIEQLEKVVKLSKTIYDYMNTQLKEARKVGDRSLYYLVSNTLKRVDDRMRSAAFEISEEKAYLEDVMTARKRSEAAPMATAMMRARRKKQMKVGLGNIATIKGLGFTLYGGKKRQRK